MDIGKTDNYTFYEGYEDEPEIELSSNNQDMETLHIWDGFFWDLFGDPSLDGKGWNGFTRDYNQFEGAFGDDSEAVISDIDEYINDLKIYENREFKFSNTRDVYNLLLSWLNKAKATGSTVTVTVF